MSRDERPTVPRRSLPNPRVDVLGGALTEDLSAAAITSNVAQVAALDRVLREVQSLRRLMLAGFAVLALMTLILASAFAWAIVRDEKRIDSIERRIETIEHSR
jgi:hypothetical protein